MENETAPPDAPKANAMKYLTVQDMLWINLQVTKKVQHFNYARLEEATFYQYGYGASRDLPLQAGRFLSGFMKLHPFDAGNEGTALLGCGAFLLLNGLKLDVKDSEALDWLEKVRARKLRAEEALPTTKDEAAHDTNVANVRDAVRLVLEEFAGTVQSLSEASERRAAS
jgi:prophage maintenance system killer protein